MPVLRGYSVGVAIRQSAATVASSLVWSLLNTSLTKTLFIRRITMNVLFDGTGAPSSALYNMGRHRTGTPTGGVATPAALRDDKNPASQTLVQVLDTGITPVATPDAAKILAMSVPRGTSGGSCYYNFEWPTLPDEGDGDGISIAPGVGLGIYLGAIAVIGDGLVGSVEWDEQPIRGQY